MGIDKGSRWEPQRHGVHRKVAALEIVFQIVAKLHGWFPRLQVIGISSIGGDLDSLTFYLGGNRAKLSPNVPGCRCLWGNQFQNLLRRGIGGEVKVWCNAAQDCVSDRPANQGKLETGIVE